MVELLTSSCTHENNFVLKTEQRGAPHNMMYTLTGLVRKLFREWDLSIPDSKLSMTVVSITGILVDEVATFD